MERDYPENAQLDRKGRGKKAKPHWIYLFTNTEHNWQKIGISSRPEYRFHELSVPLPFTLQLLTMVSIENGGLIRAKQIEKFIHNKFASRRIRTSEWFSSVSMKDFLEAVVEASK